MILKSTICLLFSIISFPGNTQKAETIVYLKELESFMNQHIPEGHVSVTGYEITLKNGILDKYTLVDGGESHHKMYSLKNATFQLDHNKFVGEEIEIYGFSNYWDVEIDHQWILSEIQKKEDAKYMISLLKKIQESLD